MLPGTLSKMRHTWEMPRGAARPGTAQERFERQQSRILTGRYGLGYPIVGCYYIYIHECMYKCVSLRHCVGGRRNASQFA
nr:hypothetical protein HUO10_001645 [Paraburkholderia busanensis]